MKSLFLSLLHGLLKIFNRPKWRTVKDGSWSYVEKILKNKKIKFYKNTSVKVKKNKTILLDEKNTIKKYDHLVIATHSDQVQSVLNLDILRKKFFQVWFIKKMLFIFIATCL